MWKAISSLFARRKKDPLAILRVAPTIEDYAREMTRLHNDMVRDILQDGYAVTHPYMNCITGTYAGAVHSAHARGWLRVEWINHSETHYVITPEGQAVFLLTLA